MIDFTIKEEIFSWHAINDAVMGGNSQGNITFTQNSCVFSGYISLENNGGFSSVYRKVPQLSEEINKITIDVLGDGFSYQLRVVTRVDDYRLTYNHEFHTHNNKRENFVFLIQDFIASFRGRKINNAPVLKPEDIREVGLLIKNNINSPFFLRLYSLNTY